MPGRGAPSALEGVKVLSFAQVAQGPAAVQLLAGLGAAVLKVEPPGGAWERHWSGARSFPGGESLFFLGFNRSQRSITVNLKHPRGREIIYRLVPQMDVVVENFRPGVMERLGLGYEDLARRNPRLIYASATGFGPEGPYRDRPGQDLVIQGESGMAFINGREDDPPIPVGAPIVDIHSATLLALSKEGSIVLSLTPLPKLAQVLGMPALASLSPDQDPDAINPLIQEALKTTTTAEWEETFRAQDIGFGRVNTYEALETFEHPRAGRVKTVRHPPRMGGTPPRLESPPPALGEHTDEVLRDPGYSPQEIEALRRDGVI